jgi:hypothetical protein
MTAQLGPVKDARIAYDFHTRPRSTSLKLRLGFTAGAFKEVFIFLPTAVTTPQSVALRLQRRSIRTAA